MMRSGSIRVSMHATTAWRRLGRADVEAGVPRAARSLSSLLDISSAYERTWSHRQVRRRLCTSSMMGPMASLSEGWPTSTDS